MRPVQSRNSTLVRTALLLCALLGALPAGAGDRQAYSASSPAWLTAVGKLEVPASRWQDGRRRHHREDCSATLLAASPGQRADTVVTAWHCLEHYRDLSRPLLFTLLPGSGEALTRELYRVADGGGMHADWAILKMHQPISANQVAAIAPHPGGADSDRPVTMAGYSRDEGLGDKGGTLTYDAGCVILQQWEGDFDTDCSAFKGASGGAVVQWSADGQPWFSGVISRGDSDKLSIFVPLTRFHSALRRHLRP